MYSKIKSLALSLKAYDVVYKNIFIYAYLHVAAVYGLYLCIVSVKWTTIFFTYLWYVAAMVGVTAGAHRLWSHNAYKATVPLQAVLIVFLSMANQTATAWVKDHRLHHKYSDTDADPHNASRGFFYSHIGWVFVRRHPEVVAKGKLIRLNDLYNNPVVMVQHRYATVFTASLCFVLPTVLPVLCWGESISNAWYMVMLRYVLNSHVFFLVNSAAHAWGYKSYDKSIRSTENRLTSIATFGEGFHNYHHVFPWDYRNAELGNNYFNYTKLFIDLFARVGWAYDLKIATESAVITRALRTGDGTRKAHKSH